MNILQDKKPQAHSSAKSLWKIQAYMHLDNMPTCQPSYPHIQETSVQKQSKTILNKHQHIAKIIKQTKHQHYTWICLRTLEKIKHIPQKVR